MNRGRPYIVALLICSLALAGISRRWAREIRDAAVDDPLLPVTGAANGGGAASVSGLSNMDSYALALLLGGLRGPLVMFLWSTSEAQKSAHDLADFDTKVEWIRLLQPEFDTVHLFQIWNKAYNVSAQMANLPNKYTSILDALDYAQSVNAQRPDDIDIVYAVANLYGDKLGASHEAPYYIQRVRHETEPPTALVRVTMPDNRFEAFLAAARAAGMDQPIGTVESDDTAQTVTITVKPGIAETLKPSFPEPQITYRTLPPPRVTGNEVKRARMDQLLDEQGNILPKWLIATHPRPAGIAADAPWYDGSELQFLKKYEPFPYGVSPLALGFNYYQRSHMLQMVAHEEHIQSSEFVIDSRPCLSLKEWATGEALEARRAELRLFGLDDQGDALDLELRAPGTDPAIVGWATALANRPDPAAGPRALYGYDLAARLERDARAEYQSHILRFPASSYTFASHVDDTILFEHLYQADYDFLKGALETSAASRAAEWAQAAAEYETARRHMVMAILRYYEDDGMVAANYPKNPASGQRYRRENIDQLPPDRQDELLADLVAKSDAFYKNHTDDQGDDRKEYLTYIQRCMARMKNIATEQAAGIGASPAAFAPPIEIRPLAAISPGDIATRDMATGNIATGNIAREDFAPSEVPENSHRQATR